MTGFDQIDLGRCRVVRFADRHLTDRYVGWLNDPAVMRFSEQRHRTHDRAECAVYAASFAGSSNMFLAVEATDPPLGHVGNITVAIDRPNASADVSIVIGEPAARGTGIGRSAWCAIVDWLLGPGQLRRVTAGTMAANLPMLALMRHSAMTIDAVRPRAFLLEGEEIDLVMAVRFADRPAGRPAKEPA